jgi:hypothetical protein
MGAHVLHRKLTELKEETLGVLQVDLFPWAPLIPQGKPTLSWKVSIAAGSTIQTSDVTISKHAIRKTSW